MNKDTQWIKSHSHIQHVPGVLNTQRKKEKKSTNTHWGIVFKVTISTRQGSTNTSQKRRAEKKTTISHQSSYQSSSAKLPSSASGTWLLEKKLSCWQSLLLTCSVNVQTPGFGSKMGLFMGWQVLKYDRSDAGKDCSWGVGVDSSDYSRPSNRLYLIPHVCMLNIKI